MLFFVLSSELSDLETGVIIICKADQAQGLGPPPL